MTCGPLEGILLIVVLLIAVGPLILPRITRNTRKAVGAFRKGLHDADPRPEVRGELLRDDETRKDDRGGR